MSKKKPIMEAAPEEIKSKDKPKNLKNAIKLLIRYMSKYKGILIVIILMAIGGTIFNIVGPKVMARATTEVFNGIIAKFSGTGGIDFGRVAQILLFTLGLYVVSSLLNLVQGLATTQISMKVSYGLRKQISEKINRMPMGYFESNTVGDVLSRITNDVDTMTDGMTQSVTSLVSAVTTLIGVVVMMLSISPLMTLVALVILPISVALIGIIVKFSQPHFVRQQAYLGKINGQVEETYSGLDVIRAYNRQEACKAEFIQTNNTLYNAAWKSQFLSGLMQPVMNLIGNLGYVAVAILGSVLAINGTITVGNIQAFIQYIKNFTNPIMQIAQVFNMLQSTGAAAERVFEFLEEPEEPDIPVQAEIVPPAEIVRSTVEFRHVRFGYNPDKTVIHDFNCAVKQGQMVAIVGPTGAGKTTMVKLLMRFYDVGDGAITVNGSNVKNYNRSHLRENFGMVLQDTWLFSGTIMENIRYGRLDATDEEVIQAAKSAHAHHFIQTLPGGYSFELNEDAMNISQGQRQLLTIARALLADNPILILDEATSSVDTRTEVRIQKAMATLMKGRTSFVIAHRLSTIRDADLILVMRDGDIVEQGNHESLMAQGGFYSELYNSQFEE